MDLTNDFQVAVPVEGARAVLTDLECIAHCMPGATLKARTGGEFRGDVKIEVGPVAARHTGTARFQERGEAEHRGVLLPAGRRETRDEGNTVLLLRLIPRRTRRTGI